MKTQIRSNMNFHKRCNVHTLLSRTLVLVAMASLPALAVKGPVHKTLRAYSMGNAFVAVAEDKDALYYNPAGLSLINRLGNYKTTPELGYYPSNFIDMRLNLGFQAPYAQGLGIYKIGTDVQDILLGADKAKANLPEGTDQQSVFLDSLAANPEIANRLNAYDGLPLSIATKFDAELAFKNFGGSIWIDGGMSPYVEGGAPTPGAGLDTFYIDAVIQAAGASMVYDQWFVGMGYKIVKREYLKDIQVSLLEWEQATDTLKAEADRVRSNVFSMSTIGHGFDVGMLYQWKRDVRMGASLRDVFVSKLAGQSITPNLTVGIATSPRSLQRNTAFSRKVNFAADFEDMLNNERNYKFFSHLNFGMEIEQVLLAIPSLSFSGLRALKARAGVGFKGGYPTAGAAIEALRVIEVEFATWAEEAGYFTGQEENRFWMFQVSMGL